MHFVFNAQSCPVIKNDTFQICSFMTSLVQDFPNEQTKSFKTRNKSILSQKKSAEDNIRYPRPSQLFTIKYSISLLKQKLFFSLEHLDHCSEKGFILLFLIFVKRLVSIYNTFFGFLFEDKKNLIRYL